MRRLKFFQKAFCWMIILSMVMPLSLAPGLAGAQIDQKGIINL